MYGKNIRYETFLTKFVQNSLC